MATNTSRRQLYLPQEVDEWLNEHGKETGVKVNTIILLAIEMYKQSFEKKTSKKKSDFEKDVRKIVLAVIKEKGIGSQR